MADEKKVSVSELHTQFDAWQVPSEEHFAQLIALGAVSFQPGAGLTGGTPARDDGKIDVGLTTPLQFKAGNGLQVSEGGVALRLASLGGLELSGKTAASLSVKDTESVVADNGGLAVKAHAPLKVQGAVSLEIDKQKGLRWGAAGLALHVDGKTLEVDEGRLRVKCVEGGGLKLDEQGCLALDLDILLARPCIRVRHGEVNVYLPKRVVHETDKIMFYINQAYCGEIRKDGGIFYVASKKDGGCYWVIALKGWVTTGDVIEAWQGEENATRVCLATHRVVTHERAPATLPQFKTLGITGAAKVKDTLRVDCTWADEALAKKEKTEPYCRWEYKGPNDVSWGRAGVGETFNVPANYAGYQVRVRVTPVMVVQGMPPSAENKAVGPMAYSSVITIK